MGKWMDKGHSLFPMETSMRGDGKMKSSMDTAN